MTAAAAAFCSTRLQRVLGVCMDAGDVSDKPTWYAQVKVFFLYQVLKTTKHVLFGMCWYVFVWFLSDLEVRFKTRTT